MGEVTGSAAGFFASPARLGAGERDEVLAALGELDARLEAGRCAGMLAWRARAAAVVAPEAGLDRPVDREGWLDLVADLLEASTELCRRGLALEGLAMEGVAGRLLGVLLGDGPEERAFGGPR